MKQDFSFENYGKIEKQVKQAIILPIGKKIADVMKVFKTQLS